MADQLDGGRLALSGFLYQILGVLGMTAAARANYGGDPHSFNLLLDIQTLGPVAHESFGQDAELLGFTGQAKQRKLAQFRYSNIPESRPIKPSELLTIATSLATSAKSAEESDPPITGFLLVSNRVLTNEAIGMLNAAINNEDYPSLGSIRKHKKERSALQKLKIVRIAPKAWRLAIEDYARSFGLTQPEVNAGISRLIGEIHQATANSGDSLIDQQAFDNLLCGFTAPHPLTRKSLRGHFQFQIDDLIANIFAPSNPFRRDIVDEISLSVPESFLIILYGPGGCGKSTTLTQFLKELMPAEPEISPCYLDARLAQNLPAHWISELVCSWRNSPHGEQATLSLQRLEIAHNNRERPIIILALDAIDELTEADHTFRDSLRRLFEFLRAIFKKDLHDSQAPRILCLATCRTSDDFASLWPFPADLSSETSAGIKLIPVGKFSDEELATLASRLPEPIAKAIIQIAKLGAEALTTYATASVATANISSDVVVNDQIYTLLKTPSIWHIFEGMDEPLQLKTLTGEQNALNFLLNTYLNRFTSKLARRWDSGLSEQEISNILSTIARSLQSGTQYDWTQAAGTNFPPFKIDRIRREAESFGLINLSAAGRWIWHTDLIRHFLSDLKHGDS